MKNSARIFKVAILEDNSFFNQLANRQLKNYLMGIGLQNNFKIEIKSYTHTIDFIKDLNDDLDIAFVDYYLDKRLNGGHVLQLIGQKCKNCKVAIMSGTRNINTTIQTLKKGALTFIFKDLNALPKMCFFAEAKLNEVN